MRFAAHDLAGAQITFSTGVPAMNLTQNFPNSYPSQAEVVPSGIHKLGHPLCVPPMGRAESYAESYAGVQTQPCTGCV